MDKKFVEMILKKAHLLKWVRNNKYIPSVFHSTIHNYPISFSYSNSLLVIDGRNRTLDSTLNLSSSDKDIRIRLSDSERDILLQKIEESQSESKETILGKLIGYLKNLKPVYKEPAREGYNPPPPEGSKRPAPTPKPPPVK